MKVNQSLLLAFIVLFPGFVAIAQQTAKVTPKGIGYLEYLPAGYHSGSDRYPVVISLHGVREKGTSSTDPNAVLRDLPRVANVGLPKYVNQGKKYPFILISPQLKSQYGTWPGSFIIEVLNHVKKTLRVDEKRIYLTGLSLGGFGVWRTAGEYPEVFAAIAPICAGGNAIDKASAIAKENVGVWGFHGSRDFIVSFTVTTNMVNAINSAPKRPNPLAKVTIFPGMGHGIWDKAYLETDLLQWMLSFKNGSGQSSQPTNSPPVVKAGEDQTLTLPANAVDLQGNASDHEGDIAGYSWSKVSGPEARLGDTSLPKLTVSDLREGVYVFRLTVKDKDGAYASDDVQITVKAVDNKLPAVNAGPDLNIALPADQISIEGKAADPDGQIKSYLWTKISGGPATLSGTGSPTLVITGVTAGTYVFRLTSADDRGASSSDEVTLTVTESAPENRPPVVNTGNDKSLTLPQNSLQLTASASDPDGSITDWQWTKMSGGNAVLNGAESQTLNVSGLTKGTYIFKLTVKDNVGAIGDDAVTVVVHDQPAEEQSSSADINTSDYTGEDRSSALDSDIVESVGIPWLNN